MQCSNSKRLKFMVMGCVFTMLLWVGTIHAGVVLYDSIAPSGFVGLEDGVWPSASNRMFAQPFSTGDADNVSSVTLQIRAMGSPSGPLSIEIWDEDGSGFPGERVGVLGTIDIGSLPSREWGFETFETLVSGLKPHSRYFVVINVEQATIRFPNDSFWLPLVAPVDGTNDAGKFLARKTPNPNWDVLSDFWSEPRANHLLMRVTGGNPLQSQSPQPQDGASDVYRDVDLSWAQGEAAPSVDGHIVYLSDNFDEVNEGIGGVTLSAENYDPGRLDLNKTYYWRVDEINGPPDFTVFKGNVWSFTTEPISYPVANITATASGSFGNSRPEKTIDGSGMVDDLHGVSAPDMWISAGTPATIEYAFGQAYKLHEMWIWNSNQTVESFLGFGAKDVVIEHSKNGSDWAVLDGVGPLARAPGATAYAANNVIDFGGAMAKFVRIQINSVHGLSSRASLSEVRFFYEPVFARNPEPENGAVEDTLDAVLTWRPGREVGLHEVFLSESKDEVLDESALIASTLDASLDLSGQDLKYSTTYYWKVNEVNDQETPNTHAGNLWHFNAPEFIAVDDMETYRDEEFLEIWAHWVDGVGDPANGSLVGNENEAETEQVFEGDQSMPMLYDNGLATVSAATRTFDPPLDWVRGAPEILSLFFLGDPTVIRNKRLNDPAPLYVVIADSSGKTVQVDYPDPAATHITSWTEWIIPVTDLGALNLSSVQSMTIGIGGDGKVAKGKMFFDNIRVGTPTDSDQCSVIGIGCCVDDLLFLKE